MVESWDEVYSSEGNNHKNIYPDVEIIRFLAKNFPLSNRSKKILDLGCGWGNNLNLLKDKKFDYYGIDYSPSRATKLNRDIKVTNDKTQALKIFDDEIESNIKKGWNKV